MGGMDMLWNQLVIPPHLSLLCFPLQGDGSFPSAFSLLLPKALNIWRLKIGLIFREKGMWTCVKSILARKGICSRCFCLMDGLLQMAVARGRPMTQQNSAESEVSLVFTAKKVRKLNETTLNLNILLGLNSVSRFFYYMFRKNANQWQMNSSLLTSAAKGQI